MSSFIWEQVAREAKLYAIRKNFPDKADDFAQYCVEQGLKGQNIIIRYMWRDFFKRYYKGGKKIGLTECSSKNPATICSFDDDRMAPPPLINTEDILNHYFHPGSNRAMGRLVFKWGFSHAEVADLFGVSYARVAQIIKGILEKK